MLLPLALLAALHGAPADSLAGTWKISMDVSGTPGEETCTFKQAGAAISGTCVGSAGESLSVTGEVKEGKVTFKHGGDYQGTALTIEFSGALASARELKGTVMVQPFGAAGTFTAAPAPAKP